MIIAGVMSGTSLDGVDAVAVDFPDFPESFAGMQVIEQASLDMPNDLKRELLALAVGTDNEIERMGDASVQLARLYAEAILALQNRIGRPIAAAGVHGQTIRHRPERGFTLQLNHPALVAELSGIDIIADFRSRDVAAGGEGAPLVPAFHASVFRAPGEDAAVLNVGGIANFTLIPADESKPVLGFDCGPGNMLLDNWMQRAEGRAYDADGAWARGGRVLEDLLAAMLADPYFERSIPKSTGRELFSPAWIDRHLRSAGIAGADDPQSMPEALRRDVAATLTELTARSAVDALMRWMPKAQRLHVCGGGALNGFLMERFQAALDKAGADVKTFGTTALCGIDPMAVEGAAFAWLAEEWLRDAPGNLPAVTRAQGLRRLGCLYPAR